MPNKKTTISLYEDTKEQLANFEQKKGETFDIILQRIMKNVDTHSKRSNENDDAGEKR